MQSSCPSRLFKPVAKRLDAPQPAVNSVEDVGPNYAIDEFDRIDPFDWHDFQPEVETPPPTPLPSPVEVEEEFEFAPPPPPMEREDIPPRQMNALKALGTHARKMKNTG